MKTAQLIDKAKAAVLSGDDPARTLSPDLMTSWQRSKAALGPPENIRDVPRVEPDLLDSRLVETLHAPLARVSDELSGTGLGLLLSDTEGRILQRWTNDRSAAAHLDRLGTVRGAVLAETTVGTNGVGTVLATGRSVQITGNEHFADFYCSAVCTGSPVRHPVSGRLLAVVTISGPLVDRADLLRPLTYSIACQLAQHVLCSEYAANAATGRSVGMTRSRTWPRSTLLGATPNWLSVVDLVRRHRNERIPLVIGGEPGAGKTSLALGYPYLPGVDAGAASIINAAEVHLLGTQRWLHQVAANVDGGGVVVVRGVETLDAPTTAALRAVIEGVSRRCSVLLTVSAEAPDAAGAVAAKLGFSLAWVPSLRTRAEDIEALWQSFSDHLAPASRLTPTSDALAALRSHTWPGNLIELRNIVEALQLSGRRGAVGPRDLPISIGGTRTLTMIERAELAALRAALEEAGGNRSLAAEILGLSRATIYRKMKSYHLTD